MKPVIVKDKGWDTTNICRDSENDIYFPSTLKVGDGLLVVKTHRTSYEFVLREDAEKFGIKTLLYDNPKKLKFKLKKFI